MVAKSDKIPQATIQRMGVYIQVLEDLQSQQQQVIPSEKLAEKCEVNSSQIRKDLAYFGEFGVRGVGYYVTDLLQAIKHFLGIDRNWNCILVGVGNLGRALLRHRQLPQKGFQIRMAFDCDPFKIGEHVAGHEVVCTRRLKEKAQLMQIDIGLITTPPERAQRAANHMMQAGIKGIINFAPTRIHVSSDVTVDYVDFSNHLISMAFRLSHP
ncbi:MAG: redox-sensing transcriptional repressor Rex [Desulfohalobiaceae bacterium]|nr:redox-sensing transcriptional repressor Rex [Desulfohalobiaceae bacterium]